MSDPLDSLLKNYDAALGHSDAPSTEGALESRVSATLLGNARKRQATVARLRVSVAALAVVGAAMSWGAFRWGTVTGRVAALQEAVPRGEWVSATADANRVVEFADGSELTVEKLGRARVQYIEDRGGLVHLDEGVAKLSVEHQDGQSWRIAAGPYEVEAIGTEFTVDWGKDRHPPLKVDVTEGTVAVRGPGVSGDRYLTQSEQLELAPPGETAKPTEPEVEPKVQEPSEESLDTEASGDSQANPPSRGAERSWRALEAEGKYDAAIRAAEQVGLRQIQASADPDALLSLARAGRLSGRTDIARSALLKCRQRFAGSKQAGMAAFLLGRSSQGAAAARWFETYLSEQPGGNLAREALGRLIEAHQSAGAKSAAKGAAQRYLARYPKGPHAALARRTAGE